jgi:hypothetical protein
MNTIVHVGPTGTWLGEFRPMIADDQSSGFYRAVVLKNLFRYVAP